MIIVDRFEEGLAVCIDTEDDSVSNMSLSELPGNVSEGDVLVYCDGRYDIDKEATNARREKMASKLKGLFNKNKGSNV
jgi:hypothetical protein